MPRYGGLSGLADSRGTPGGTPGSTYDYGGRLMPGGAQIFVGYSRNPRLPQYVGSVDLPYPMGSVPTGDTGGGTGGPITASADPGYSPSGLMPYPYPDMNIPPYEDINPTPGFVGYGYNPRRVATTGNWTEGGGGIGPAGTATDSYNAPVVSNPSYIAPGAYPSPGANIFQGYIPTDWTQNAQSGYGFAGRARGFLRNLFGLNPSYPDLSSIAGTVFDAAGYPVPGGGNFANAAGDWRQNAARAGTTAGLVPTAAATGSSIPGGNVYGSQFVSEFPAGLGSTSWQQAGGSHVYLV